MTSLVQVTSGQVAEVGFEPGPAGPQVQCRPAILLPGTPWPFKPSPGLSALAHVELFSSGQCDCGSHRPTVLAVQTQTSCFLSEFTWGMESALESEFCQCEVPKLRAVAELQVQKPNK